MNNVYNAYSIIEYCPEVLLLQFTHNPYLSAYFRYARVMVSVEPCPAPGTRGQNCPLASRHGVATCWPAPACAPRCWGASSGIPARCVVCVMVSCLVTQYHPNNPFYHTIIVRVKRRSSLQALSSWEARQPSLPCRLAPLCPRYTCALCCSHCFSCVDAQCSVAQH
jgi:hypothetical protein